MEYKYGQNQNYEDFSSGRVLYHGEGMTNFPVRLAQEIYGRCLEYSPKKSHITLYDCCCGGGYLLTVLGFLNQDSIGKIIGSDINEEILHTARKNLSLLTLEGIDKRIKELEEMILNFSDLPYGNMVNWEGEEDNYIDSLLDSLYEISTTDAIIGLCMDKKQKVKNEKFKRLEKQQVGKRRFEILRKI